MAQKKAKPDKKKRRNSTEVDESSNGNHRGTNPNNEHRVHGLSTTANRPE